LNVKQYLWAIKVLKVAYKVKKICKFPATAIAAMTIFETGYGGNVPTDILTGKYSYNLFGVKCLLKNGKILYSGNNGCVLCYTHEESKERGKYLTKAYFRAYKNYYDSFLDAYIDQGVDVGRVYQIGQVEFRQFNDNDVMLEPDTWFIGSRGNISDEFD